MVLLVEPREERFKRDQLLQHRQEPAARDVSLGILHIHLDLLDGEIGQVLVQESFVLQILFRFALLHFEERRLGDIDIPALQQLRHLAEEEGQQQGPDMAPVDVGVGHENDLVIARLGDIERVFLDLVAFFTPAADAGAERHDQGADFVAREHLVEPGFFHIENFALEREDRLVLPVAALLGGPAGRISLDDVELAQRRILLGAVRQLAGQRAAVERALPADQFLRLPGRFARPRRIDGLADDFFGDRRILFEISPERVVDRRFDDAFHFAVAELGLCLAFELGIAHFHADDRRQAFAHIVAAQGFSLFLEQIVGVGITVDRARERGLEADEMRPAFFRVDVVGERKQILRVAVVVLQRQLENHVGLFDLHINRLMDRRLGLVEVFDERDDAALVLEDLFFFFALVLQGDFQALVQERQLAEALRQHVEAELERLEDLPVRLEGHLGAAPLGFAGHLERRVRFPPLIALFEDLTVLPDFEFEPFGERIHDRDADAVQTARNGIGALLEFAAGMEDGQRHFSCGFLLRGVHAGWDTPAVVDDGDTPVDVDRHLDRLTEPRHVFVDAVVDDFVDKVMQAVDSGAPDIHGRAFPHGIETFEDLNLIGVVAVRLGLAD